MIMDSLEPQHTGDVEKTFQFLTSFCDTSWPPLTTVKTGWNFIWVKGGYLSVHLLPTLLEEYTANIPLS
jgi:hypothetical protein